MGGLPAKGGDRAGCFEAAVSGPGPARQPAASAECSEVWCRAPSPPAVVKAVLRGGQPSPRTLLEVVRGCAPAVTPQDEPLLADLDALASSSGEAGSGGKAPGEP